MDLRQNKRSCRNLRPDDGLAVWRRDCPSLAQTTTAKDFMKWQTAAIQRISRETAIDLIALNLAVFQVMPIASSARTAHRSLAERDLGLSNASSGDGRMGSGAISE